MFEVEVKIPVDHDQVCDHLEDRGADHVGTVEQVDTYYDAPHRDFATTDEAFRIREERTAEESETRITYKGPLVEAASKTREEFETRVADGETMRAIVESLGFDPAATVRKDRERFALEGFTVTLDVVENVGTFLEIETEVETDAEVAAAREDAFDVLRSIGLDPEDSIRTSYLALLLEGND